MAPFYFYNAIDHYQVCDVRVTQEQRDEV